jgi:hypothetical protein
MHPQQSPIRTIHQPTPISATTAAVILQSLSGVNLDNQPPLSGINSNNQPARPPAPVYDTSSSSRQSLISPNSSLTIAPQSLASVPTLVHQSPSGIQTSTQGYGDPRPEQQYDITRPRENGLLGKGLQAPHNPGFRGDALFTFLVIRQYMMPRGQQWRMRLEEVPLLLAPGQSAERGQLSGPRFGSSVI